MTKEELDILGWYKGENCNEYQHVFNSNLKLVVSTFNDKPSKIYLSNNIDEIYLTDVSDDKIRIKTFYALHQLGKVEGAKLVQDAIKDILNIG